VTQAVSFVVAVVDDDERVLESLENLLESAGYVARLFSSATALLESRSLDEIDCLIADIGMSVMDGFELQRLAKAARPELPVILITGRHDVAKLANAADPGGQPCFKKPFDGRDLLTAVGTAVRRSRQHESP